MAVTLIHTADWQIGKQFGELPDDAGALLRSERLACVARIAALAAARRADAVVVAGDVFDTNAVADETVRRLVQALSGFAGPWLLLPGNHDAALAESVWTRLRRMGVPANVHLLTEPVPWHAPDRRFVVLPAPLVRRRDAADPTAWFDACETPAAALRIGLAHGSVANRLPEAAESGNVIADDRAATARLDYLALGDWHGMLEIAPRTWYAGTHEPDRFKDNDAGNALVVTLDAVGGAPAVERVPVGRFRWRKLALVLRGGDDLPAVDAALAALGEPAADTLAWVEVAGTLDFAARARLDEALAGWAPRLFHLRIGDEGLVPEPSDDDLDRIDRAGFVRDAVERLRAMQRDPGCAEADVARRALYLLYAEHVGLGR